MDSTKQPNIQKRDTTFKQEHGAVTRLVNRRSEKAVARAAKGAEKLLAEDNPKQALNVLTLAKGLLSDKQPEEKALYFETLAKIHVYMDATQPALKALAQAQDVAGISDETSARIARALAELA